jgi:hypothetical protein
MDIDDPLLFEQNIIELKQKHQQSHLKQYESMRLGGLFVNSGQTGLQKVGPVNGSSN